MVRLPVITEEMADEQTQKTYDAIKSKFGMLPNLFKGLANSSVALNAFLQLDAMISTGSFTPVEQEMAKLVVSQHNGCGSINALKPWQTLTHKKVADINKHVSISKNKGLME